MNKPNPSALLFAAASAALLTSAASAQSLFQRPIKTAPSPAPANGSQPAPQNGQANGQSNGQSNGQTGAGQAVAATAAGDGAGQQMSLFAVTPPKAKSWQKHDKIELIINESSLQKSEETLESKKDYNLKAELKQFPSLEKLFTEATLGNGIGIPGPSVDINGKSDYKGEGTGERKDRFTARISALVLDVKPNGMLVVEAREIQQHDEETMTLVVSGICDPKDITVQGTVLSTQIANLAIRVDHEGDVRASAKKGWIPRVFDAIFGL
jgi:flagellar L-ring protein FlgH